MDSQTIPRFESATVACMATYPGRFNILERSAGSIAKQVDHLFIYVNDTLEGLPDLTAFANITILDAAQHKGNISANGKVYPIQFMSNCLIFTIDDDFMYPPDYVSRVKEVFDLCKNRCCVAVHGSILPPNPEWYYDRIEVYTSHAALEETQLVNLAGSGTFAFHQSTLNCEFKDFEPDVQVDLRFSILARKQALPIWCLHRPKGWLTSLDKEGLWQVMRKSVTHHTYETRRFDWSFLTYREIARDCIMRTDHSYFDFCAELNLNKELISALRSREIPSNWRANKNYFATRKKYLQLLKG